MIEREMDLTPTKDASKMIFGKKYTQNQFLSLRQQMDGSR